jgi:hypothetical protein
MFSFDYLRYLQPSGGLNLCSFVSADINKFIGDLSFTQRFKEMTPFSFDCLENGASNILQISSNKLTVDTASYCSCLWV